MKILAIETATELCSVALLDQSGELLQLVENTPRSHTQRLLPMLEQLLAEAGQAWSGIDRIAVSNGPGAFTGLRIGLACAQGLALARDLPVVPVSTLAALADTAAADGLLPAGQPVMAMLDARMDELYWGVYQQSGQGEWQPLAADSLAKPELIAWPTPLTVVGNGAEFRSRLHIDGVQWYPQLRPQAAAVARLARTATPQAAAELQACYLRDQVAWQR